MSAAGIVLRGVQAGQPANRTTFSIIPGRLSRPAFVVRIGREVLGDSVAVEFPDKTGGPIPAPARRGILAGQTLKAQGAPELEAVKRCFPFRVVDTFHALAHG